MVSTGDLHVAVPPELAAPLDPVPWPATSRKDLEEFAALDELQFLTLQGRDRKGHDVICIVGKMIPASTVPPEVLLRYSLHSATRILTQCPSDTTPLTLLYWHCGAEWGANCPGLAWLRDLQAQLPLPLRQRLSLGDVYVVHPSLSLRAGMLLLSPWIADGLYSRTVFVSRFEFLDEYIDTSQELEVPSFVLEHDEVLEKHPLMDYGLQLDPVVSKSHMPYSLPSLEPDSEPTDK